MLSACQDAQHQLRASRSSPVLFLEDAMAWCVVFFLLGAPVLPVSRAGMTLVSALVVALTWPLSVSAWAVLLTTSLQRDRQMQPVVNTAVDLFTSPVDVPPHDSRLEPAANGRCSVDVCTEDMLAREQDGEPTVLGCTSLDAAQLTRCFVLAAILLIGGLFGQLDWQAPYQMWPYPSLSAYVVARAGLEVYDRVGGEGGALHAKSRAM
ncbi:hypothetical protein JIQ42_01934 [Leishmania sp. Namibia]|uniref:hypothetical protein n=1 Tax=Leishmania sp. Namibia TaxID=2802991 RepID=UPI001B72F500|nr:hypothetical protein JIQ42_01934 [Leishmania sp. Namibia]